MALKLVAYSDLTRGQIAALRDLQVSNRQKAFAGSFEETLQACLADPDSTHRGFGILDDGACLGLFVLKRPPSSPDWVPDDAVSLHGLKIDRRRQGQGLGRRALSLLIEELGSIWPGVKALVLSVDAANAEALALYRSVGMEDSGPAFAGRLGQEHRMHLVLPGDPGPTGRGADGPMHLRKARR